MRTRAFGNSGRDVPLIGQGTYLFEREDSQTALRALRQGIDLGLTHLDTAEMYGQGAVEELVGRAIAGRREDVFLVSKVLPENASRAGTLAACERSLKRLSTERIDVLLLHFPSEHPLPETVAAFEHLKQQGKIGAWGLSNFDLGQLRRAVKRVGPGLIACNQVEYHLRQRYVERGLVSFCADHGIALVAYSPFGQGDFPVPGSRERRVLDQIGAEQGVSARAVALAYLTRHPGSFAVPKAVQAAHLEDNARGSMRLTQEQIKRIDAAFPLPSPGLLGRARRALGRARSWRSST